MRQVKYFLALLIITWVLGFFYMFRAGNSNSRNHENAASSDELSAKIKELQDQLTNLESKYKQNEQVITQLNKDLSKASQHLVDSQLKQRDNVLGGSNSNSSSEDAAPSSYHEEMRRKVFADIKDVSFYMNERLAWLEKHESDIKSGDVTLIKSNFQDRINLLLAEMYNMSVTDSFGEWRRSESRKLAAEVQQRFVELQNPTNCAEAKKIVCDLSKACGFGCQIHHLMYCMFTSFATERVLILNSIGWSYNANGYEAYFQPLSNSCRKAGDAKDWSQADLSQNKAIKMPYIDTLLNRPIYLPQSVPKQYAERLSKLHGDPFVWWAGQVLTYLMRYNEKFDKVVADKAAALKFRSPCVGVHVRRTDKVGSEAAYHGIDEYMLHVANYFDAYEYMHPGELKIKGRNVYLATDEPTVIAEAKSKYPEYNFICDETNAKSASLNSRYTPDSAQGVILDVHFLSQSDYLVCTFSSQVCRLAYELFQNRFADASWRFKSLDDVYYFGGQNAHNVEAVQDHEALDGTGEISMKKGDLIGLAGNHWNGYSKGRNLRTNVEGLFPSYKVKDVVVYF